MKILIIGGTHFLGRHFVETGLKRNHEITLFNRGLRNRKIYPELEKIYGDREIDLELIGDRHFDAVIDTCGYFPRVTKLSVDYFKDRCDKYLFISTVSVYKDFMVKGIDETYKVGQLNYWEDEEITASTYGPLKAVCEQRVQAEFKDRAYIIRPGLIVGPYDPTDRFTYWLYRTKHGGKMLVPGNEGLDIQFIDARDLANFSWHVLEQNLNGCYNVTGPSSPIKSLNFYNKLVNTLNIGTEFVYVKDEILLDYGVEPFTEMPLWVPANSDMRYICSVSVKKALANGLKFSKFEKTVEDTLDWFYSQKREIKAGISPEKEKQILAKCLKI